VVVIALLALQGCAGHQPTTHATATTRPPAKATPAEILVTGDLCAPRWAAPDSGVRTFAVHNIGPIVEEVELESAATTPRVFGDIETLGPATTRTLTVAIGPGRYQWKCELPTGDESLSAIGVVGGRPFMGRSFLPVTYKELSVSIRRSQAQVEAGLGPLVADTDRLLAATNAGDLARARALWLPAHLDYERLGDAYDSFGGFADEIDGRPDGLPDGVHDRGWQGFLRLEHELWNGGSVPTVQAVTHELDANVHALAAAYPSHLPAVPPNTLTIRVHEILENTLQFQLTGDADEGSHTTLATVAANLTGAEAAYEAVEPLLRPRSASTERLVGTDFSRLQALLAGLGDGHGDFPPLSVLTRAQREQLDAAVGQAVEDLATIPDVLESPKYGDG
jgi:high-affinity iron transporter